MDVLSKWKQHSPLLRGDVDLEMLGPDLLASRHHGLMTDHLEGSRKNTKTLVQLAQLSSAYDQLNRTNSS